MTDHHPQRGILQLSFRDLVRLLKLPEGHVVERLNVTDVPYAPGLLISVSGPAMPFHPPGGVLYVEDYTRFIETAEERMEGARKHREGTS